MFCYQCQEALKNVGCTKKGVCGKSDDTANLQDMLVHAVKGLSLYVQRARQHNVNSGDAATLIQDALFVTVTNVNFDAAAIREWVSAVLVKRDELKSALESAGIDVSGITHDSATWSGGADTYETKGASVGVLSQKDEDVRSLRELLIYGVKGIAAYASHAAALGKTDDSIYSFMADAMASTTQELSQDEMVGLVLKAGEVAVTTMALLDEANTSAYGNPEITEVSLGVRNNPGILISGHDLKDLADLLSQTKDTGIDVYTHGEMLPAHYYPAFKKYPHFAGNYGGAWYDQKKDFEAFQGPVLMTTNCLVPPSSSYKERVYTTGVAGFAGLTHISERNALGQKDFSAVIAKAKQCAPPQSLEDGTLVGGFAHAQVLALADKVVAAVKSGAVKKFVVMAGCDGRQNEREYFTDVANALPENTIILTAGCAKFRYNKLPLGEIGGIPRILDAGQCNDSYSLAVVALKLKEVFGLEDINDLPIEFDIAWYEQKAVTVLLALLYLGVKGIRLGPTLPAFLSPNVAKVLVENFNIQPTGTVKDDVAAMMG
ncbi:MAG: hydroxylamine reductase [Deltaproteobacteria bacterium]|nr:hydroxylamine reductase [Deltaproteobacteria bacterium]MBN2672435.1 hydroxylamine reductase [Deltaproteobacteria bacterium]